jgi:hypothetical protein
MENIPLVLVYSGLEFIFVESHHFAQEISGHLYPVFSLWLQGAILDK